MPHATAEDGIKLYYEEAGTGEAIIFVHEFAGDYRSWEAQMRFFSRRHRCVTFSARGYPRSDLPDDAAMYSQDRARDDIVAVLDHLGIDCAHIVGLSMGGAASLQFGLRYPERAISVVLAATGSGSEPDRVETFREGTRENAENFRNLGAEKMAEISAVALSRVQFLNKDPRGHAEFAAWLAEHPAAGSANTMQGVQGGRPSIWDQEAAIAALRPPALIIIGDEDEACIRPALFLKRVIPAAGLMVMPRTGHCVSQEEPDLFNRALTDFFAQVQAGKWGKRDPRAVKLPMAGMPD
jgi:pimeloyl-ACP methyl ester carboxylesterase